MFKDLFGLSSLLDVPLVTMVFFMLIFAAVIIRILSPKRSPHYRSMAQLPLDDTLPELEEQR